MSGGPLSTDVAGLQARVLDHAREFVEVVYRQAPREYETMLASGRFEGQLAGDNRFNHGKLYAYAEFLVFRREFRARFPDASTAACVNAFSGLLLKNDISITNLVDYFEGSVDQERRLLDKKA